MPIQSWKDYREYLAADIKAHSIENPTIWHWMTLPVLRYQRRLRYVEYLYNCRKGRIWRLYVLFWRWRLQRMGVVMGFDIQPNVFGPGLCIVHWGTIMVSPLARIGANCRIHPSTSIGQHKGAAPTIGDNVYVGPGAKLFGRITVGNRVTIGPNAVVYQSVPDDVTIVAASSRVLPRPPKPKPQHAAPVE